MIRQIQLLFFLLSLSVTSYSQLYHEGYTWSEEPTISTLSDSLKKEPTVSTKDLRCVEYYLDPQLQNIFQLLTMHRRIVVNTDEGVEAHNRVYIPIGFNQELVQAKARVILPSGEIILLDKNNIKTAEDLNEEGSYTFFPIDGAIKNSEIEYIFTIKSFAEFNGSIMTYQSDNWKLNNEFMLICPSTTGMAFHTIGNFPQPTPDSISDTQIKYSAQIDTIPPLYSEPFSARRANLGKVIFKLESINGRENVINYGDVSENFWQNTHKEQPKKVLKSVDKILNSEIGIESISDEFAKVRAIEDYIKTNYFISDQATSSEVLDAISQKYTSKLGMTSTFCLFMDRANVSYELVATSDRTSLKFQEDFESHVFLKEIFMYFPSTSKYVSVHDPFSRIGLMPYEYTNTHALFIKGVTVGDYSTGVGKIKYIESEPASTTISVIDLSVDLTETMEDPTINLTRSFTGYTASSLQPYYSVMDEENKTELNENMINLTDENTTVVSVKAGNTDMADFNVKPLTYTGEIIYHDLIFNAGDKYLLNIGKLIGPQVPLYRENDRKLPVENTYNRTYNRTISVTLPEGYTVKNLDELNIDVVELDETAIFKSSYTLTGSQLKVDVLEQYSQIEYSLDEYEAYKKVMNTAADFNKIVLVLVKQ
jgi:hypothetical protein